MKTEDRRRRLGRTLGVLLLPLAVLVGFLAAALGFLLAALVTASVPVLVAVALVGCGMVSAGLGWVAGSLVHRPRRGRVALGVGVGTTLLVAAVAASTIFEPLVPAADIGPREVPPEVAYWDLATGSRIAYRRVAGAGSAPKPPVVYVHGGPGAGVVAVAELVRAFSFPAELGHDVLFYDQVGGGVSERLTDITQYTLARHVADLEAVRERLGAETFFLVCESWGAELCTHYLATHSERVERLVLVSPGALYPEEWGDEDPCDLQGRASPEAQRRFREMIGSRFWAAAALLEVNPAAAHAFLPDAEGDAMFRHMVALVLEGGVCEPGSLPPGEDFSFGMWANLMTDEDYDLERPRIDDALGRLDTPVLILRGECDYCVPEVAAQYEELLPGAALIDVAGAGHFLWLEAPDVLADRAGRFLADSVVKPLRR